MDLWHQGYLDLCDGFIITLWLMKTFLGDLDLWVSGDLDRWLSGSLAPGYMDLYQAEHKSAAEADADAAADAADADADADAAADAADAAAAAAAVNASCGEAMTLGAWRPPSLLRSNRRRSAM